MKTKVLNTKRCPRCHSQLFIQGMQVWCSFVGNREIKPCAFGLDKDVLLIDLMRGTAQ